ncbi:heptaprenylglyceryl phosphate synthase [Desulfofalx alkaliphila]|uniref:heptaprenylglyceryl phosphate synthase n=1 Tax=Desulfofalx alkaliphila TaxID=105483 RepID=UPI0004E1EDB2|nr:heptaprenylglyceryl phosphate synthase [Desulfofalx alkaliphila]
MWSYQHWKDWKLVAKLDPDKTLPEESLEIIKGGMIDAVMVGGTQRITYHNTAGLIKELREYGYGGPLVQEISNEEAVVPWVDAHFIPVVLNTGDKRWLVDAHLNAIKKYKGLINWDKVVTEGYLVCNQKSAVGRLTGTGKVNSEDAAAYAVLAENIYRLPVLYIEYSGSFGDLELIKKVAGVTKKIHLIYGGGIKSPEQLQAVYPLVDTVVLGNIFYENAAQAKKIITTQV